MARRPARYRGRVGSSSRPALKSVGVPDVDSWPVLARSELKLERHDLARNEGRILEIRLADQSETAIFEAIEFQGPGVAINQQQFPDAPLGVELEFLARSIVLAVDLHSEIRPAQPVRPFVDRGCSAEERDDIGTSVILPPFASAIADVRTGKNPSKSRETDGQLKGDVDQPTRS